MAKRIVVVEDDRERAGRMAECPAPCPDMPLDRQGRCSDTCSGIPRDERALMEAVRIVTREALKRTGWDVAASASLLGLEPEMLLERMRQLQLAPPGGLPG